MAVPILDVDPFLSVSVQSLTCEQEPLYKATIWADDGAVCRADRNLSAAQASSARHRQQQSIVPAPSDALVSSSVT